MEQLKNFLKYSQTLSAIGIILILFSVLDIMEAKFLTINFRLSFAVAILGLYHVLHPITRFFEPDD